MSFPGRPSASETSTTIRPARPEDYAAFERLFPELAVDDRVADRDRFVREMMATTLIADRGAGRIVGYAYFQIMKDTAYVRQVVTAPEARKAGVGRALMAAVAERARAAACTSWCLNVKPDNAAAIALYERLGLARAFGTRALRVPWSIVDARPTMQDARVAARLLTPDDDARVEPAMSLLDGQLAVSRLLEGRVLMGLFDDDTVLGAAVFDPSFPGAYPFRAARGELALVLLGALHPYARPSDALVDVVIEGQPDVADALVEAGATVKLDIVQMKGPLPAV